MEDSRKIKITDLTLKQCTYVYNVIKNIYNYKKGQFSRLIFKEIEISRFDSHKDIFYLCTNIINKGTEGTLAEHFCRDYRHIRVGKNGGLKLLNSAKYSDSKKEKILSKTQYTGEKVFFGFTF